MHFIVKLLLCTTVLSMVSMKGANERTEIEQIKQMFDHSIVIDEQ